MTLGQAAQAASFKGPCLGPRGFGTVPVTPSALIPAMGSRAASRPAIEMLSKRRAWSPKMSDRRELYRSPNGDTWFLGREPANGHAFIIHQPNAPSGGRLSHIELGAFLREAAGPEQQALLRLIGTLVDVPPYADRT